METENKILTLEQIQYIPTGELIDLYKNGYSICKNLKYIVVTIK